MNKRTHTKTFTERSKAIKYARAGARAGYELLFGAEGKKLTVTAYGKSKSRKRTFI